MLSCFWSSAKKSPEEPRLPERRVLDESHKPAQQLETPASGYPFSDDPGSWLKEEEEYYPKTRETARKHIEWLRAQKRVDKPDRNARALNAALKQNSGTLYADRTHFVLELLQNADDNKFKVSAPTMRITYTESSDGKALRIDCNEVGFSAANIEAICSLGESSKIDTSRTNAASIGEKGIGFKSVFDVASAVWIYSRFYSFKFVNEESAMLGMIAPLWAEFPDQTLRGYTSLFLRLNDSYDTSDLLKRLKSLEPDLLFLRNLMEVQVSISDRDKPWKTIFKRRNEPFGEDNMSKYTISSGNKHNSYRVFRREVVDLEHDYRRSGCTKSELMLAFPIRNSTSNTSIQPQLVYAFLPVQDYGLPFSLQADFLLVTSREKLDSSGWNKALLAKVPQTFLGAVEQFNQGDDRYSWLTYVPTRSHEEELFRSLPLMIIEALRSKPILESQDGRFHHASDLIYIPKKFKDFKGTPLVPPGNTETKYISLKYAARYEDLLQELGVTALSRDGFIDEFAAFVSNHQNIFQSMSPQWHSQVSQILISGINKDNAASKNKSKISRLALVPVSGIDKWVAPIQGIIFFPPTSTSIKLPKGVGVLEVAKGIEQDSPQHKLLSMLAVRPYDQQQICEAIVQTHSDPAFNPKDLSIEDLIYHVVFLKRARWAAYGRKLNLWVVTADESRRRSFSVYLELNTDRLRYTAATVFNEYRSQIHFLHKRYEEAISRYGNDWIVWLAQHFELTVLPRMALVIGASIGAFILADDFRFLLDNNPQMVLSLLRQWWNYYKKWVIRTESGNSVISKPIENSKSEMRAALSSMKVKCRNGGTALLGQTYLPRRSVVQGLQIKMTQSPISSSLKNPQSSTSNQLQLGEASGSLITRHTAVNPVPPETTVQPKAPLSPGFDYILSSKSGKQSQTRLSSIRSMIKKLFRSTRNVTAPISKPKAPVPHTGVEAELPLEPDLDAAWSTSLPGSQKMGDRALSHRRQPEMESSKPPLDRLLEVPDPDEKSWDFLEYLGVIIKIDVAVFLNQLRLLRDTDIKPTRDDVDMLYEQIEHSYLSNEEFKTIDNAFATENLVYIPAQDQETSGRWVAKKSCVWTGPAFLKNIHPLDRHYPERSALFQGILKLPYTNKQLDKNLAYLIQKAKAITENDELNYIEDVFAAISGSVESNNDEEKHVYSLRDHAIFPTRRGFGNMARPSFKLQTASDSEEWYIPDRPQLAEVFADKLDYLAFSPRTWDIFMPLFGLLKIKYRLLSSSADSIYAPEGERQQNHTYSSLLKNRIRFITALIPSSVPNRVDLLAQLQHLEVLWVDRVIKTWTIRNKRDKVTPVHSTESRIALLIKADQRVQLFVVRQDSKSKQSKAVALELAQFCQITDSKLINLLESILIQEHEQNVADELQRHGISFDAASPNKDLLDIETKNEVRPSPTIVAEVSGIEGILEDGDGVGRQASANPSATDLSNAFTPFNVQGSQKSTIFTAVEGGVNYPVLARASTKDLSNPSIPYDAQEIVEVEEAIDGEVEADADTQEFKTVRQTTSFSSAGEDLRLSEEPLTDPHTASMPVSQSVINQSVSTEGPIKRAAKMDTEESHVFQQTPSFSPTNGQPPTNPELLLDPHTNHSPKREPKSVGQPANSYTDLEELPTLIFSDQSSLSERDVERDVERGVESIEESHEISSEYQTSGKRTSRLRPPKQRSRSPSPVILPSGDRHSDPSPQRLDSSDSVNMRGGWMSFHEPTTLFMGEDTKDTEYFGELYVSRLLQRNLGITLYDPNKHWTSHLRTRNGHTAFVPEASDSSTFTITEEADGKLSALLIKQGTVSPGDLIFPCTFHIEVCTTNGDLSSPFSLSRSQYEKCKRLSLRKNKKASDVYLLARAYKAYTNAGISLYADPWRHRHVLNLRSTSGYIGNTPSSLETLFAQDSVSTAWNVDTHEIYRDLEVGPSEFRLLKLRSGADDEPLHGSLSLTSVDSPEKFWAISYVWGNKGGGFTFTTEKGSISITESLSTCLAALRHEKVEVPLWADAVCIDQRNNVEKSMQVRRMGSLYKKAAQVIIWMGPGDEKDGTCSAIKALHGSSCRICGQQEQVSVPDTEGTPPKQDPIPDFLRRSWFTRAWIIQESVLASDIFIKSGRSEITWDCFMASLLKYEESMRQSPDQLVYDRQFLPNSLAVIALKRTREKYKQGYEMEFLELLKMFAYAQSSRPRDKLFALLNLACDWPHGGIPHHFNPDYDSGDEQVLVSYAEGFVQPGRMKVLDLLYHAGRDKSCGFCSWIPDFMDKKKRIGYPPTISTWQAAGNGTASIYSFHAGKRTPTVARLDGRAHPDLTDKSKSIPIVAIKGYVVDTVDNRWELRMGSTKTNITFPDAWDDVRTYTSVLTKYPGESDTGNWKDTLMFKLLIGDARGPYTTSPLDFSLQHHHRQQDKQQQQDWDPKLEQEILSLELDQKAKRYAEMPQQAQRRLGQYWQTAKAFTNRIPGAAYCATEKGYVGIVPGNAQTGDKIFIAHEAAVPFVVRAKQETHYYELIGECYIHGLMYYHNSTIKGLDEQELSLV